MDTKKLEAFIVRAKAATYVGNGSVATPSRPGSHDLTFTQGEWSDVMHFSGREAILVAEVEAYALDYHGGLVKS